MASFLESYKITMGHEGLWSNLKLDRGGETFMGISRRFFPSWPGWIIIDRIRAESKDESEFSSKIAENKELRELVPAFYKANFWDRFAGDEIAKSLQPIANELFDTAVNMGVHQAVKILQYCLNKLNRNQTLFPNLAEDGGYGRVTAGVLFSFGGSLRDIHVLYKMMNVEQGHYYNELMTRSEDQEGFARGWYKRVTFGKQVAS